MFVFGHILLNYWHAGQSCGNYLRKIGLIYVGADSINILQVKVSWGEQDLKDASFCSPYWWIRYRLI